MAWWQRRWDPCLKHSRFAPTNVDLCVQVQAACYMLVQAVPACDRTPRSPRCLATGASGSALDQIVMMYSVYSPVYRLREGGKKRDCVGRVPENDTFGLSPRSYRLKVRLPVTTVQSQLHNQIVANSNITRCCHSASQTDACLQTHHYLPSHKTLYSSVPRADIMHRGNTNIKGVTHRNPYVE